MSSFVFTSMCILTPTKRINFPFLFLFLFRSTAHRAPVPHHTRLCLPLIFPCFRNGFAISLPPLFSRVFSFSHFPLKISLSLFLPPPSVFFFSFIFILLSSNNFFILILLFRLLSRFLPFRYCLHFKPILPFPSPTVLIVIIVVVVSFSFRRLSPIHPSFFARVTN